ncbi:MAG: pentapeptide repeat-containing protein [Candidatus Gracilibacteria bacterium]|jgi:hypothetical protein
MIELIPSPAPQLPADSSQASAEDAGRKHLERQAAQEKLGKLGDRVRATAYDEEFAQALAQGLISKQQIRDALAPLLEMIDEPPQSAPEDFATQEARDQENPDQERPPEPVAQSREITTIQLNTTARLLLRKKETPEAQKKAVSVFNKSREQHPEWNPDLQNIDLRETNLEGINLQGANLQNAYLERANLTGAILEGANLRGASMGAILTGANLRGADLRGTDFREATLTETILEEAKGDENTLWPRNFNTLWPRFL